MERGDVFTVCTQCKRVLLPSRTQSAPCLMMNPGDDDVWLNSEDMLNPQTVPTANLSHGLCALCFKRLDELVDSLPQPPPTPPAIPAPIPDFARPSRPATASTRVLVVDDNKLQRHIHKRMVEQRGFQCDTASSAAQAVEMVLKRSYCLVLMDLMMGETDGWTASKQIRKSLLQLVGYASIPRIVAVTGMDVDAKLIKECADAGMVDIMQKPVAPALLHRVLAKHVGMS